ncbi:MAG: PqqD family peptide modification chaperone [Bradymonadaceae bacterium]|nr:PqqD family peptide modification chaperone [Lujinxingiaceae bacterium]
MMDTLFSIEDRFLLRDDLVIEEVEDEFLILDLSQNSYFGLNALGRVIWQALGERKSFGQIVENICESFDVEAAVAAADANEFIVDILERGLARKIDG